MSGHSEQKADRRISAGRLADRVGDADQHERERSHRTCRHEKSSRNSLFIQTIQSTRPSLPTIRSRAALHIMASSMTRKLLLPAIDECVDVLKRLEEENAGIIKIGRTHLQDATPLYVSNEISGWRSMLEHSRRTYRSGSSLRQRTRHRGDRGRHPDSMRRKPLAQMSVRFSIP